MDTEGQASHRKVPYGGIIEERQEGLRQYGPDWADKPVSPSFCDHVLCSSVTSMGSQNDTLMFLIEEANKIGHSVDLVIQGVLSMNFAALHTTSMVRIYLLRISESLTARYRASLMRCTIWPLIQKSCSPCVKRLSLL